MKSPFLRLHHAKVHDDEAIPTYKLQRIIGLQVNIEYLLGIGLKPIIATKNGAFWRKSDIPMICKTIMADLGRVIDQYNDEDYDK